MFQALVYYKELHFLGETPIFLSFGVSSMFDTGITYDKLFKCKPKGMVISMPNDFYGHRYLMKFHLLTLKCFNQKFVVVCS